LQVEEVLFPCWGVTCSRHLFKLNLHHILLPKLSLGLGGVRFSRVSLIFLEVDSPETEGKIIVQFRGGGGEDNEHSPDYCI